MDTFDYVIVGAGTAGCILANRLSEDASVCVLEAGPRDWHPYIHIPAGFIKLFHQPGLNWLYTQEPSEWTGGRRIVAPRGKTLGGSSSINGHIYNRGQRLDYDGWAQRGNRGWGYADVLPYFKRLERRIGEGDETFRGRDGALTVTDIDQHHPLCEAFIAGAMSLGIPRNPDYNGESQLGINYAQRAIHQRPPRERGARVPASRDGAQEPRRAHARARDGPDLRGQARGRRALPQGRTQRRAGRGARAARGDPVRRHVQFAAVAANVRCRRARAPAVARHRGAPRAARRRREPARSLRAARLGAREEHAARSTSARAASSSRPRSPNGASAERASSGFRRRRSTASGSPQPHLETSDMQLTFTPASYLEGQQGQLEHEPGMTSAPWQQRPESKGYVRIRSADPFEQPEIQPRYLTEEIDRRVLVAAMRLARGILKSKPLEPYYDYEDFPGDKVQSDDEMLAAAKQRGTTTFHPMGTCRMGPDSDPTSVVDDELRVRGLEGLRVADASIMPMMLSANINAGVMMIADKASDMIRGKAAPQPIILR